MNEKRFQHFLQSGGGRPVFGEGAFHFEQRQERVREQLSVHVVKNVVAELPSLLRMGWT